MELQGKNTKHTTQIKMDDMAWNFMLELKQIAANSIGLECSHAVVIRRALAVYFAHLKQKIRRAKTDGTIDKVLAREQKLIKYAAGKPHFNADELTEQEVVDWLRKEQYI